MSVLIKGMKMPKNEECAVLYIHEADGEGYVNCFTGERGKERTHCQYECIEIAEQTEPQTMLNDGTLVINVEDATKVGRVLVGDDKNRGGLYYLDDEDEPQTETQTETQNSNENSNVNLTFEKKDEPQTDCPYREYPCDVCDMQTDCAWK